MRAENVPVPVALDLSYRDLTSSQQLLSRRLGLVPGPDFDAHATAALDDTSSDEARRHIGELYNRHLLAPVNSRAATRSDEVTGAGRPSMPVPYRPRLRLAYARALSRQ